MKLSDFINLTNPADYDFKNEMNDADSNPNLTSYPELKVTTQKIFDTPDFTLDKILLHKNAYSKKYVELSNGAWNAFDCDCCPLMNEIYESLWGCAFIMSGSPKYDMGNFLDAIIKARIPFVGNMLERDTMNSFKTTYNQAVLIEANEINVDLLSYRNVYGCTSIEMILEDFPEIAGKLQRNADLNEFATLTHTIGNFTMIPNPDFEYYRKGFNVGRYYPTKDYWDLTLMLLKKRLQSDELFNAYIQVFDLNDYIENGEIVRMFERKTTPWHHEPQTRNELTEFLQTVNKKIRSRGKRMVEKLR
ncbi:MAG: hypothetical protein FWD90_09455 [Defluviitaleaceae bacterium]|nr:hypothetical protein [Defluviitaleaceae bacterium]